MILNRTPHHRPDVCNKLLRHATAAQKHRADLATRFVNHINVDGDGPCPVFDVLQIPDNAQIDVIKTSSHYECLVPDFDNRASILR